MSIKFGSIFIKSMIQQTFWVRNDLDMCIAVQLDATGIQQLQGSYLQTQVIPPQQQAGFEVLFQSQDIESFKGFLKYKVNNKHDFFIQVEALVEPVKLNFNKTVIKCNFTEDNVACLCRSR